MPSGQKIQTITNVLEENKEGIWLSKIAEKTNLDISTVHYYLYGQKKGEKFYGGFLKDKVEISKKEGNMIKLRLKMER